jgi:hypothetical protein
MRRSNRLPMLLGALTVLALFLSGCNRDCVACSQVNRVQEADFSLCVSLVPNPATPEEVCQAIGFEYLLVD